MSLSRVASLNQKTAEQPRPFLYFPPLNMKDSPPFCRCKVRTLKQSLSFFYSTDLIIKAPFSFNQLALTEWYKSIIIKIDFFIDKIKKVLYSPQSTIYEVYGWKGLNPILLSLRVYWQFLSEFFARVDFLEKTSSSKRFRSRSSKAFQWLTWLLKDKPLNSY